MTTELRLPLLITLKLHEGKSRIKSEGGVRDWTGRDCGNVQKMAR